jgi:enediyne biosynthesis protein E4
VQIKLRNNNMSKLILVFLVLSTIFIIGCDDSSNNNDNNTNNVNNTNSTTINLPPENCQVNGGDEVVFTEVTEETKIGPDGVHLLGNRLGAVDINSDGYPDIIVHKNTGGTRDPLEATDSERGKRILLNVVDPEDSSKRIFVEYTAESGYDIIPETGERGRGSSFAVAGDLNGDGLLDLVSGVYGEISQSDIIDRSIVLLGDGNGHFTPMNGTEPFNDKLMYSNTSSTLLDYDRDGQLDIFMGYFYKTYGSSPQVNRLFRNSTVGSFRDVTYSMGLDTQGDIDAAQNPKPTWGVTACDINSDGWTDLVTSNYGRAYNMLWVSNSGDEYENHTLSSKFGSDSQEDWSDNQFYVCHCVVNPGPECTEVIPGEQKINCDSDYWNVGVDDQLWRNGGNTGTTICADFNNDGHMDLYNAEIQHWHIGSSSDPSRIMYNMGVDPPMFERPDIEESGLSRVHEMTDWNQGDIYAMTMDINNDSLLDIVVGDTDYPGTKLRIFMQKPDHTFEEVAEELGIYAPRASGITYLDYDQDGDSDILVGFSRARCTATDDDCIFSEAVVRLFRNDGGNKNNRVVFRLSGGGVYGKSNTLAIGAVIKITVGGVTQTRELQTGYGHHVIQTPLDVSFGLGQECVIDRVEISWPNLNRTVTVIEDVPANYVYYVSEDDSIVSWDSMAP